MQPRQGYPVQKIAEYASNRGFTNLVVLNENRKEVNGLLLVHLPNGPTANFKVSNLVLSRDIKVRPHTQHPARSNPAALLAVESAMLLAVVRYSHCMVSWPKQMPGVLSLMSFSQKDLLSSRITCAIETWCNRGMHEPRTTSRKLS